MAIGKCPKCPKTSRDVLLIGGMCNYHFKGGNDKVERNVAPVVLKALAEKKKTLSAWYDEQLKQMPSHCENCRKKIIIPATLSRRTPIAHILPKSSVKSVQTHELNRWFACWQCHTNYDQWPVEKVSTMPIIKTCRARYKEFADQIADNEKKYIPEYLK